MKIPGATLHFSARVRFGIYLARRVRQARLLTLAADIEKSTAALVTHGRALEDAASPIQEAMADRDSGDDGLDRAAQTFRANAAGRSADATKTAPYTLIFPDGLGYYTAAPLDEEVGRYNELKQRVEEHFPAADSARITLVAAIDTGLPAYIAAVAALAQARTAHALASTRLAAATEGWVRQMERTYGALVQEYGKADAELFFPRARSKQADAENFVSDTTPA